MTRRRQARELAMKLLYQNDIASGEPDETLQQLAAWAPSSAPQEVREFALDLVRIVLGHRAEIDDRIAAASEHWRIGRMSAVDRNIVRLATAEILHLEDIPPKVSINEAVDLAKKYGDEDSARFVNGVLDRVYGQPDSEESDC